MTRVLVVEDDPGLARALAITLRARHYEVDIAHTGSGALEAAASRPPDLLILDLGLPDLDGMDVLHAVRGWSTVNAGVSTMGSTSAGRERRRAARTRASSSPMPKGLVT
jgi:two-component system KDP operon response regulator KdpE